MYLLFFSNVLSGSLWKSIFSTRSLTSYAKRENITFFSTWIFINFPNRILIFFRQTLIARKWILIVFTCKKFKIFSAFQKNGCDRMARAVGRLTGSRLIMSLISSSARTPVLSSISGLLNNLRSHSYDKMFNCRLTVSPNGCIPLDMT